MSRSTFAKHKVFDNISVVLVSPQVPENIGLAARCLKNTGFSHLRLVCPSIPGRSFDVAKRARDILDKAKIFPSLAGALADVDYVCGTTRRRRSYTTISHFRSILPQLVAIASTGKVAIVFGKEDFGLSRDELSRCDSIFCLPADPDFASYNLAFSAGIVCYSIMDYCDTLFSTACLDLARKKDIDSLLTCLEDSLSESLGSPAHASTMAGSLRRLLSRTLLTRKEAELLKTICRKLADRRPDR